MHGHSSSSSSASRNCTAGLTRDLSPHANSAILVLIIMAVVSGGRMPLAMAFTLARTITRTGCRSGSSLSRGRYVYKEASSLDRRHRWQQQPRLPQFRSASFIASAPSATGVFMSAMENVDEDVLVSANRGDDIDRVWNLAALRKEVSRQAVRCHKKVGKAKQRSQMAQQELERLTSSDDVSLEELEASPNVAELAIQADELQCRLKQLNQLEVFLQDIKGKSVVLPEHIAVLAIELEINDHPPTPNERGSKKEKGPKKMESFRLPYRRFYTENKTEIRVGKQAEDNDELSLSPEHRDSLDWWMHASGCPGSHVVIRCHDQNVNEEVVQDAAALAARQSKCNGNVIKVTMTRARDVKKPPGAKAGLVQLTGQVRTVVVNMNQSQARLDRLDKTVIIN